MGATNFAVVRDGKTANEAFTAARDQALYEYGHRGYTGTIAEKHGFVMRRPAMPIEEALNFSVEDDGNNDKWGDAFCIPIKPEQGEEVKRYLFYGLAPS